MLMTFLFFAQIWLQIHTQPVNYDLVYVVNISISDTLGEF